MRPTTSYLEISKTALRNNLQFIRKIVGPDVQISSVIKGNAYGHGIEHFVPIAQECGIQHFSVFSPDEAERVLPLAAEDTQIMIMGWVSPEEMEWVITHGIQFFVFDLAVAYEAVLAARQLNTKAQIHIELETGMNRTGLKRRELNKLIKLIKDNQAYFDVKGVCTHYAGAESIANYVRVKKQISQFNRMYKHLINQGIIPEKRHSACSAAAISYPNTRMDMVRIGILQYGFWPSRETFIQYVHKKLEKKDPLMRVISWKSRVMSIKTVKEGEFISYGTNFLAQEDTEIAVVPVGYSHGYSRSLSNAGYILIHGQRANVVGLVNMNMLIADITGINDVKPGDEAVLIGNQGEHSITVASFSDFNQAVNYELLVRLPDSIKRRIVE